jgi:hypothetical protein
MFAFVILWQAPLVHSFCTYHNLYHIPLSVFCDANNEQSLVDRMFDIPNESKSKNRCAMTYYLQAFGLTSLNFLFEVKDVKTSTNFSSVLGDHLIECKLLLCCLCGILKTNKNVNCVAEPQELQALLYILSISNSS